METFSLIRAWIGHLVADRHTDPLSRHMPALCKARLKLEMLMTGLSWMRGHDQGGDISAQLETGNGKLGVPLVKRCSFEHRWENRNNSIQPNLQLHLIGSYCYFHLHQHTNLYFTLIFNVTAAIFLV